MFGFGDRKGKGKSKDDPVQPAPPPDDPESAASSPAPPTAPERAPLLPQSPSLSTSTTSTPRRKAQVRHGRGPLVDSDSDTSSIHSRRTFSTFRDSRRSVSLSSILCLVVAIVFFILLVLAAILHIWLGHLISEQAKSGSIEEMARRGVIVNVHGVALQNSSADGIVVTVDGTAGVDVRQALDWQGKETGGWARRTEGRIAKRFVDKVSTVSVGVGRIVLAGGDDEDDELVVVEGIESLLLPLSYPTGKASADMDDFTLELPIDFPDAARLSAFLQQVWESKQYAVTVVIHNIEVKPRQVGGWFGKMIAKLGSVKVDEVHKEIENQIPEIPGSDDPASLVSLLSYSVASSPTPDNSTLITMSAEALLKNPLRHSALLGSQFSWGMPYDIPVSIYLPPSQSSPKKHSTSSPPPTLIAKVSTAPFSFPNGAKTSRISLEGYLVPMGNLSTLDTHVATAPSSDGPADSSSSALSKFVANYLAGKNSTVLARYDASRSQNATPSDATGKHYPPALVGRVVEDYEVALEFPGSSGKVDVFQDLTIEDMKIRLASFARFTDDNEPEGDLLCSGKVVGHLVLPDHFESLEEVIDVSFILPDVFVYDGQLPSLSALAKRGLAGEEQLTLGSSGVLDEEAEDGDEDEDEEDAPSYPPTPLPANAFARLATSSFIPAITSHTPKNATHNATTTISATFVDAPLYLIPERSDVFRKFLGKIIFGAKTPVGVRGVASIEVAMGGWGQVGLGGLPIEGEFNVGM